MMMFDEALELIPEAPDDWGRCHEPWAEITHGGSLIKALRTLIQNRATDDAFDAIQERLNTWKNFTKWAGLREQWQSATELVKLARLAVNQPNLQQLPQQLQLREHASQIERVCFYRMSAWQWDAYCALRGEPRQQIDGTRRAISILAKSPTGEGALATLEVEIIADGTGDAYPDPMEDAFVQFDDEFADSVDRALELAKLNAPQNANERERIEGVDMRYRLKWIPVAGGSARHERFCGASAQA
ncbi:MAG TPA: hypothetical protein EYP10_09615, partial [Armatimonadetes bacterium]|nr:hypothetical protein [Armatimonadota bacterium]